MDVNISKEYTSRGFNSSIGAPKEEVREGGVLKDWGLEKDAVREVDSDAVFFLYRGLLKVPEMQVH